MDTWNKLLKESAEGDVILTKAPSDEKVWDEEFDGDYGRLPNGSSVLAWSEKYVYFPVCYDGSEWIDRAPRSPQDKGQLHVGGW